MTARDSRSCPDHSCQGYLRSLERDRERLALVLDGTRLGLWDWNPQTNEVTFDERWANMLGHTLDEIPFDLASWESRVHPDDLQSCYDDIGAHMRGETDFYENVHRMRHKEGHWIHILDRGRITERDESGAPIRFTGTHTDISRQMRAEEAASAALRAKQRFLAAISHEIRTPLHGMFGVLDILSREQSGNDMVDLARKSGAHLVELVEKLLDVARAEQGQLKLATERFVLAEELRKACDVYVPGARSKGLDFDIDVAESVPEHAIGDPVRVRQIVGNLVSNAVKFTSEGRVAVSFSAGGSGGGLCLRIVVTDTGIGMEDTVSIFDEFRQADSSISRRFGGAGLGLAIVRHLVGEMNGAISVESVPGRGTTFTVELELGTAERGFGSALELHPPLDLARLRVLVVDDHRVNRLVLETYLREFGIRPVVVASGREAVAASAKAEFDVAFVDLHMPGLDGQGTTELLRGLPGGERVFVCAVTADVRPEVNEACKRAGVDEVLGKPFALDDLRPVLSRAAERDVRERVPAAPRGRFESALPPPADRAESSSGEAVSPLLDLSLLSHVRSVSEQEDFLGAMIADYSVDASELLAGMHENRAAADLPNFRARAHALAGVSAAVGALRVSRIARALQRAEEFSSRVDEELRRLDALVPETIRALTEQKPQPRGE